MVEVKKGDTKGSMAVCFSCSAAPGKVVCLAGIFNDWDPERNYLEYSAKEKIYRCTLHLPPGTYEYKLVVDGEWLMDESNPNFVTNDFGTLNSVVTVK